MTFEVVIHNVILQHTIGDSINDQRQGARKLSGLVAPERNAYENLFIWRATQDIL